MQISEEDLQSLIEGVWQWQSNKNPWSKYEEPQWESYSPKVNLLLEEALFDQQKEVDIGDWIVSLEHMLQTYKQDKTLQRPIKRIDWMEDEEKKSRSTRYCDMESPKPFNKIFGSPEEFIISFSKRSLDFRNFAKLFKEIEKSENIYELNTKICPEIQNGIIKEFLKLSPDKPNDVLPSLLKKKIQFKERQNKEKLILSFQKHFQSFQDFYGEILRVYTMDTFLYRNLNKYLRDENWNEISDLLPFTFCLSKAFFMKKPERGTSRGFTFELYRGVVMSEATLQYFDHAKQFSWFAPTSTTRNRKTAEKFMEIDKNQDKCRVLFIIEVNLLKSPNYLNHLDLSKYSVFPKEEEVLLPPGTLLEIGKISKNKNKTTIIHLKLIDLSDIYHETSHKGQNELQEHTVIFEGKARIMWLEGELSCQALKSIYKETMIEEVEFYLCTFDHESLREVMNILPTMERAKVIKFVLCSFQDQGEISSGISIQARDLPAFAIQIYERQSFYKIFGVSQYWTSLRSLSLIFKKMTNQGLSSLCSEALQCLVQLASLDLDVSDSFEITDEGVSNLSSEGLKYITKLESLNLNFSSCPEISIKGVNSLVFEGLRHLLHLKSLNLDFSFCEKLTEKRINDVCSKRLWHLTGLKMNVKAYHSRLEPMVFNIRRFFNLISDDGQIANWFAEISQKEKDFEKLRKEVSLTSSEFRNNQFVVESHGERTYFKQMADLILREDVKSIENEEPIPYQSPKKVLGDYFFLQKRTFYFKTCDTNVKLLFSEFEDSLNNIIIDFPEYLNFRDLFDNLAEKIWKVYFAGFKLDTCFTPLNLHRCPFWMRDKRFDNLIFSELRDHIRRISINLDCSETEIEALFKPWFEQISLKKSKRYALRLNLFVPFNPSNPFFNPSWTSPSHKDNSFSSKSSIYFSVTLKSLEEMFGTDKSYIRKVYCETCIIPRRRPDHNLNLTVTRRSLMLLEQLEIMKRRKVRGLQRPSFLSKNSEQIRFPKKAQRVSVFPRQRRGHPFF